MDSSLPTSTKVDLIIIGGGCAGLSLATQLAARQSLQLSVLVLESRTEYENDRTWCFWRDEKLKFDHMVESQWNKVQVKSLTAATTMDCRDAPYQLMPSSAFYTAAEASIAACPQIRLLKSVSVLDQPRRIEGSWHLKTDRGDFQACMVVDSRPSTDLRERDSRMWQSFYGQEIECDSDIFDPTVATLMDFTAYLTDTIRFTYVLPSSSRRALVEHTVFSTSPKSRDSLKADCDKAVKSRVAGRGFQIIRSEHGILPMSASEPICEKSGTYVRVGLHAGAARPSTGYAFQRIQRWAASCAAQLAEGGLPTMHPRDPVFLSWMDNLFLSVLARHPALAPDLFYSVFKNTKPKRLIRFMSDNPSFLDCLSIVLALPARPFLSELRRKVLSVFSISVERSTR